MTTRTQRAYLPYRPDNSGIFYPERPDELPDAMYQFPKLTHTMDILLWRYEDRPDVLVSGDNAIYYEPGNPRVHRSPDGFIAFGVDRNAIWQENGYKVWEAGKPPDWALEIASALHREGGFGSKARNLRPNRHRGVLAVRRLGRGLLRGAVGGRVPEWRGVPPV